jgi:hypothetical protein
MARAVATLEGDSSSLVDAIDKAKGSMQKLDVQGKKLTDQLRDVADEADKAAGALVNKIGGPTAIKAIAGVTAGFAAAQTALGAFSGSMQAFYSTQGEKGAKAMADIDAALSKMQSQLFTAVIGTEDMEEATQTLITGINFLTDAVRIALIPIEALAKLVRYLTDSNRDAKDAAKNNAEEQKKAAEMLLILETNYKTTTTAIGLNEEKVKSLTGSTEDLRKTQLRQAMSATDALAEQLKADERMREAQEIGIEVAKKKADNLRETARTLNFDKNLVPGTEEYNARFATLYAGLTEATINTARMAREGWSAETAAGLKALGAQRDALAREMLGVNAKVKTAQATATGTVRNAPARDGAPVAVEETAEAKMFREMGEYMEKGRKAQEEANAKAYADGIAAEVAKFRAGEAEKEAIRLAGIEKEKADEQAAFDFRKGLAEDLFQVKAKLLVQEMVAGKSATKVAAEMARKAIGDAISAKGDEAMAQAAIYAASFNPMAIPMAAAGVAAYAAAAALGSSAKKSSSATPASAAPPAAPVNTAFNLRVDAAFADGESIARQFAMMQRSAQRRGLVPAGA